MSRRRKPQRGVCGECGCAVLAPSQPTLIPTTGMAVDGAWRVSRAPGDGWANGHQFDEDGKLVIVRCPKHGGLGFPRGPVPDATVLM